MITATMRTCRPRRHETLRLSMDGASFTLAEWMGLTAEGLFVPYRTVLLPPLFGWNRNQKGLR